VVGAEFRGRVHEGSFGVLGPEFKRVFLGGVSGGGNEFGVYRNAQLFRVPRSGRRKKRLLMRDGFSAWLEPSSQGGLMEGDFGSWVGVQSLGGVRGATVRDTRSKVAGTRCVLVRHPVRTIHYKSCPFQQFII